MKLDNRVAVITGAGSGIGCEIARLFAQEGARIVGLDRDGKALARLLPELVGDEREHLALRLDLRDASEVERRFAEIAERAGRIDVLVNSAGVREIRDVFEIEPSEWENVLAINLSGTFYCCQAAARRMRDTGGGAIVNLSSVASLIGISHRPAYTASKHGVVGLTRCLAKGLAPYRIRVNGIRVNAIAPGTTRTPMTEAYFSSEEFLHGLAQLVPLGTYGEPQHIAQAALFLASEMAAYVTGVTLPVDGGWLAENGYSLGEASVYHSGHATLAEDGR